MKKSIRSIAAFAAALTMTFSCVPMAYAVGGEDVPAAQTEAEETKTGFEFTEGKTFETPYNGVAIFTDDDGTAYYYGYDKENQREITYTLDENGEIKNSYSIYYYVNDEGEKTGVMEHTLKQCGDYLYLLYSEGTGFGSRKESVAVKLDKELNEISKNKFAKSKSFDTNGDKIVYLKGDTRIYICDMDGKNNKMLYNGSEMLNSVAVAGNYVGFQKRVGYSGSDNCKEYCGLIDINTGEVTMLKEQRRVQKVFSSSGNIIWYGPDGYTVDVDRDDYTSDEEYWENHYKYYDTSELYIFDGEDYSVFETANKSETGHGMLFDNEGNLITSSFDGKGNVTYRIYRGDKLLGEYTVSYKGYCGFTVNNGVLTICYTGRDMTSADWIGYDPETTTPEELEAELDKTPAAKDKMKSVTIFYK